MVITDDPAFSPNVQAETLAEVLDMRMLHRARGSRTDTRYAGVMLDDLLCFLQAIKSGGRALESLVAVGVGRASSARAILRGGKFL